MRVRHRLDARTAQFFADLAEADRFPAWSLAGVNQPVLVVGSLIWKAAVPPLVFFGLLAATLFTELVMLIDGAGTAVHFTPSQDAVGVTALVTFVSTAIFVVVVAVRWWRRPAVTISDSAVASYQIRPIAIPWPMVAAVVTGRQADSAGHRGPGVLLADGRFIRVAALRRLAVAVIPLPSQRARSAAARQLRAYPQLSPRDRAPDALPGPASERIRLRFRLGPFGGLFIAPLSIGFMVLFPAGNGGAQSGTDVGGAVVAALCFEAVAGLFMLCRWVTLTREIAVGPGWIAWRPRLTSLWRVLPFAELVSTIDAHWPRRDGVRLTRADGSSLRLRPAELAAGISSELSVQLAAHPAATHAFLDALQKAAAATSDQDAQSAAGLGQEP